MKVSNREVWDAAPAARDVCEPKWPVPTAFKLVSLARKLQQHYLDIDQVRRSLVEQFGAPDPRGQMAVDSAGESFAPFLAAFQELLSQEIEVDAQPVALPSVKGVEVSPSKLLLMGPFISFEE